MVSGDAGKLEVRGRRLEPRRRGYSARRCRSRTGRRAQAQPVHELEREAPMLAWTSGPSASMPRKRAGEVGDDARSPSSRSRPERTHDEVDVRRAALARLRWFAGSGASRVLLDDRRARRGRLAESPFAPPRLRSRCAAGARSTRRARCARVPSVIERRRGTARSSRQKNWLSASPVTSIVGRTGRRSAPSSSHEALRDRRSVPVDGPGEDRAARVQRCPTRRARRALRDSGFVRVRFVATRSCTS